MGEDKGAKKKEKFLHSTQIVKVTTPVACDNLYSVITRVSTNKAMQKDLLKNTIEGLPW